MGFFDTLKEGAKKMADRVTGGYGDISFEIDKNQVSAGDVIKAAIKVSAKGELKAKRVLVRLRGVETCKVDMTFEDEQGFKKTDSQVFTNTTMDNEFELCGALEMKEGEVQNYQKDLVIPPECQPTYYGPLCQHRWEIEADVDVPWGKDLKAVKEITVR
jgi:hypothetical protein